MRVCFLSSGNGGNFKFLFLANKINILKNLNFAIIADRKCGAAKFAKKNNIYSKVIKYNISYNKELLNELKKINPDIIITNWHKILDKEVVLRYSTKMINLHYSLLPDFAGMIGIAPIKKAIDNKSVYIGATCHYVNEDVDCGEIISQFKIINSLSLENAIKEIFKNGCLILLNSVLIVKKSKIIKTEKNRRKEFYPKLSYNDNVFDSKFWETLSNL